MSEENTAEIRKTKYIYRDLFSNDFFVKCKTKRKQRSISEIELNLNLTSDEQEEEVFQKLNEESNSLYQLINEQFVENVNENFKKIGEISDNYQRVIDTLNLCIWRTNWGKEIYEKISSEIKKLKEEIKYLEEKKKNLENVWFFKKLRLNFVNKDLTQANSLLAICMKILQSLDPLKQKSQKVQQLKEEIKYLEEKKKNLENAWFFKQFRLNRIEKNLREVNAQLTMLQIDLARVAKLSHKLTQFYENKVFVDNISLNIQNNDLNTKISIHEILSSKKNSIQYIEKNPNSETHSGKVSTVYSTKDENGNEKFVKPGQTFLIVPDAPDDIENNIGLNQAIGMGYLNLCLIPGEMYYVDSASRQFIENFVADMLGFGEYFVHTEFAIDNSGKSVVMNKAIGQQALEVLLYKSAQKAELSRFLDSNTDIAVENGNQKLEIKNGKVSDLVKNPICITQETQLSALAIGIVDFICIQSDRHCGNFFIDKNGKITAIDNDAVGIVGYDEKLTTEIMKVKVPFVTSQIKERIISLYNNKDILLNFLRGKMNIGMQGNKVILEMKKRLNMLYNYVTSNHCPIYGYNNKSIDYHHKIFFINSLYADPINYFLLAHNNFLRYCNKVGYPNDFIISESNPIALIIHNSPKDTFNRFTSLHYFKISNSIIDELSKKGVEKNKLVESVVQKVSCKEIDRLMLRLQISCEDAIQIVINPIIESMPYFNKYSQSKAERMYEKVCRKIDDLFPESHLFDFSHTANQPQHQNYQEH